MGVSQVNPDTEKHSANLIDNATGTGGEFCTRYILFSKPQGHGSAFPIGGELNHAGNFIGP